MTTPAKRTQNWLPGIFNECFGNEGIAKANASAPALNIVETEKEYIVEMAVPGVTKDDFCVTVDKHDQLIVTVESRNSEEHDKKGKFLRREFSYSQFQQTLILPENVNKDEIQATQCNGVLTITIPKNHATSSAEPKRIEVK
jgi:HSP20 family protein